MDEQQPTTDYRQPATGVHTAVWQELVTSALLGTDRRGLTLQKGNDELGKLLAGLEGADAQEQLLGAAAVLALYTRAGRLPETRSGVPVQPCEEDSVPRCSNRSAHHLVAMLEGQYQELLGEWLQVAASMGKRAPEELLPSLLELGRTNSSFREPVTAVLGKRGLWLAAQRPDWKSAYVPTSPEEDEALWETGSREERLAALANMRSSRPERARELVGEAWASEPADARVAFIKTFETHLSMQDEPFLEGALDDKSKQVREIAAELLAKLPESRLVARMTERALALAKLFEQKNLFGARSYKLSVSLPEELDRSALRDGVGATTPSGQGKKAGWLVDIVKSVPPQNWCYAWGRTPEEIIKAASGSEWQDDLLKGWIQATEMFKDLAWAEALLDLRPEESKTFDAAPLLSVLAPERREAWVLDLLRTKKDAMQTKELAWRSLWTLRTPWSAEVSRSVLRATHDYLQATAEKGDWEMRGSILYFVRAMSPAVLDEAAAVITSLNAGRSFYSDSLDKFAALAPFRRDMLAELWR